MANIRVLPIHLVNKIAAGEVIERPASVVKELVENALDAGSTRIAVAVEDGGRKLISVTDDGCGMGADDLALAFFPHATSKIVGEDDLFRIATMGFRGEALASIASISHAHIRTRRADEPAGHEVHASGEQAGAVKPCAAACGTCVTVRDLFFNTPARRKFLKSTGTELGHISEQIARLALPHPKVAFSLVHNGRTVQDLPPVGSTAQRVANLFGPEVAEGLMPLVARRRDGLAVAGLIGSPASARASGKWQYFFLNGRYIRDRLLSHALKEAYRGLADPSRWPTAFIFVEVNPIDVDVNVHPTKIEVRFRDSQLVHGELLAALRESLNRANLTPQAVVDLPPATGAAGLADELQAAFTASVMEQSPDSMPDDERRASLRQAMADFFKSAPPQPKLAFADEPRPWRNQSHGLPPADEPTHPQSQALPSARTEAPPGPGGQSARPPADPTRPYVQIHNSYIVVECPDGLEIVDQHALHERIVYNELRRRLAEGPLAGQRLLIPQTVSVTGRESAAAEAHAALLARLGIELAPFGPGILAIQQFPALLSARNVPAAEFVRQALDSLVEDASTDAERLLEALLQTIACKAAVKAGDLLSPQEIDALLAGREHLEKGSSCPHGRPTALKLTLKDLQKQFKRT